MNRVNGISLVLILMADPMVILGTQNSPQAGYATIVADGSNRTPTATALLSYINSTGVAVGETSLGAAAPMLRGRMYVDETATHTGFVLVNTSPLPAVVELTLRDYRGEEIERRALSLQAGIQVARYVSRLFSAKPDVTGGSLTF